MKNIPGHPQIKFVGVQDFEDFEVTKMKFISQAKANTARLGYVLATVGVLASVANLAYADENDWRLRIGPGHIAFDKNVTLSAGGAVIPGAGARLQDNTALLAEIGYRVTPNWSAGLTFGIPPTTKVNGTGTAEPFGEFGRVKYGPLGMTAQYQFNAGGTLQPYVGAGAVYYMVFSSKDAAITQLEVDNAWGSVIQVGADYNLTPTVGLFFDVRKLYLKTTATGFLPAAGGAPVKADATLNPLVIHAGLLVRF